MSTHAAPARQSFSLDVAAPSLRRDGDAPWTGAPSAHGEAGLAAMFWVSFHALSAFVHAVLITLSVAGPVLLAIVPIPFLAAMCSEVKHIEKPIERVEMAIIEIPPPPPPVVAVVETPPPPSRAADVTDSGKIVKPKKVRPAKPEMVEVGMIALLSKHDDSNVAMLDALSSDRAIDASVFGTLSGDAIGESFGAGGLGLRGVGEGGGGRGEGIGLGTIGTGRLGVGGGGGGGGTGAGYGRGAGLLAKEASLKRVRVTLNELNASSRARLERMLTMCALDATHSGTITVVDDAVTSVELTPGNACATRQLQRAVFDADGTFEFTITPRAD